MKARRDCEVEGGAVGRYRLASERRAKSNARISD